MQKTETTWAKDNDWKSRYSKLYSSRHIIKPQEDTSRRISFMSNDSTPYTSLLVRMRSNQRDSSIYGQDQIIPVKLPSNLSEHSTCYNSYVNSLRSDSLGGNDTLLLDMVRAHSRELEELQDKTLDLPGDETSEELEHEACVHGMTMRMTERSVSRSRVSRMSTRRDMDIPSILAFTASATPGPATLEIPAFQKINASKKEDIPRWSIRRSVCPVCSQRWRDRSSVKNVKYSGLKRNFSSDFPSVIAPARLRASITMAYVPRPALPAIDADTNIRHVPMRNSSTTWQFTRARRFRTPKLLLPSPEAAAPPNATAPMAQQDLDTRVSKFLCNVKLAL